MHNTANMPGSEIQFIHGQHVRHCQHDISKVFEGYFTLQYMESGRVSLKVDREQYALNGRYFWSAWPGPKITFHASNKRESWNHRYIAFRGGIIENWTQAGLYPIKPQRPPGNAQYAEQFDRLLQSATSMRRWDRIRAVNLLESILIDLAEARDMNSEPTEWIKSVQIKLTQSATSGVDYESLSEQMGISVRTLRRNFRKKQDSSPHQFLIHERIQSARQLLLTTDIPLKEIAQRTGYSDVFYFSRQFKKITGTSPALFRRSREG